jgi:hypothetical protein
VPRLADLPHGGWPSYCLAALVESPGVAKPGNSAFFFASDRDRSMKLKSYTRVCGNFATWESGGALSRAGPAFDPATVSSIVRMIVTGGLPAGTFFVANETTTFRHVDRRLRRLRRDGVGCVLSIRIASRYPLGQPRR